MSDAKPLAWIGVFDGEPDPEFIWWDEAKARRWISARPGVQLAPLFLAPTLTDAEREAIGRAIDSLEGVEDLLPTAAVNDPADTLRGLLTRCAIGHQDRSGQTSGHKPMPETI